MLPTLVATVVALAMPCVAQAQIYTWRDGGGNLVLSDHPKDGTQRTYAVVGTSGDIRTTRVGKRSTTYDSIIDEHATQHGVRSDLVRAVIQAESAFDRNAVSSKGAQGLMQLMPDTARRFGVTNAYDPRQNIFGGVRYLRVLANLFNGDIQLTIAAYNAGEGAVMRYGGIPPYQETQDYVVKVLGHYRQYRSQATH